MADDSEKDAPAFAPLDLDLVYEKLSLDVRDVRRRARARPSQTVPISIRLD